MFSSFLVHSVYSAAQQSDVAVIAGGAGPERGVPQGPGDGAGELPRAGRRR